MICDVRPSDRSFIDQFEQGLFAGWPLEGLTEKAVRYVIEELMFVSDHKMGGSGHHK